MSCSCTIIQGRARDRCALDPAARFKTCTMRGGSEPRGIPHKLSSSRTAIATPWCELVREYGRPGQDTDPCVHCNGDLKFARSPTAAAWEARFVETGHTRGSTRSSGAYC